VGGGGVGRLRPSLSGDPVCPPGRALASIHRAPPSHPLLSLPFIAALSAVLNMDGCRSFLPPSCGDQKLNAADCPSSDIFQFCMDFVEGGPHLFFMLRKNLFFFSLIRSSFRPDCRRPEAFCFASLLLPGFPIDPVSCHSGVLRPKAAMFPASFDKAVQ